MWMTPQYAIAIADIKAGLLSWDLWGRMGWADTKRRYRRTVIGPFWTTISLAIFVVVLGVVWSQLWNQDSRVYMPFLASGMITWMMFSGMALDGSGVFISAEALIKQLRVPFLIPVCAVIWRNLIVFGHNLFIYILIAIWAGVPITWATLLAIPGMVLFVANALWIAIVLGLACARYRDIQQLLNSLLQISMFVTPIFWSPTQLRGRVGFVVDYNPLFHLVEVVRSPLMGKAPALWSWLVVGALAVAGWALAIYLFSRFHRRLAYWL